MRTSSITGLCLFLSTILGVGFIVNQHRFDPYKNYKFRVIWDGKHVAGVSKISGLKRFTEPVIHRDGGEPNLHRVSPGTWKYEPITLERGVTHDHAFENWANLAHSIEGDAAMSLKHFRKDIIIELLNERNRPKDCGRILRGIFQPFIRLQTTLLRSDTPFSPRKYCDR